MTVTGYQPVLDLTDFPTLVFSAYMSGSRRGVTGIICPVPDM